MLNASITFVHLRAFQYTDVLKVLQFFDLLELLSDSFSCISCHNENVFHLLSQHVARIANILCRLCLKTSTFNSVNNIFSNITVELYPSSAM